MSGLEAPPNGCIPVKSRVLMFTMHEAERLSGEVRQAGAHGFVLKSQAARDLIRAIDCLLAEGRFWLGVRSRKGRIGRAFLDSTNRNLLEL